MNGVGSAPAEPSDSRPSRTRDEDLERIEHLVEHAAHWLPAQGPITVFVHHNTLHAFEDLPFADAVQRGMQVYGCHPFLPEERYQAMLTSGRIRALDLEAVLAEDLGEGADERLAVGGTRSQLRLAMLLHPPCSGSDEELRWLLAETDALIRFSEQIPDATRRELTLDTRRWAMRNQEQGAASVAPHVQARLEELTKRSGDARDWSEAAWEVATLELLWRSIQVGACKARDEQRSQPAERSLNELVRCVTGVDTNASIDELLIRFCSAFLDQGFANWPLPERELGFFRSFLGLYRNTSPIDRGLRELPAELARIERAKLGPLECIHESLELLGLAEPERERHVTHTLQALRGFAGMLWQMETNAEWTTHPAPKGTLIEYVAVRLILERIALRHVAAPYLGPNGELAQLSERLLAARPAPEQDTARQRAFVIFQIAQLRGWSPAHLEALSDHGWSELVREVEAFSGVERRRIYQLAFERKYREQTLDAVLAHCRQAGAAAEAPSEAPAYQVVTCIDEREESFRRHLEEVDPACETLGIAGFFGVAMYYRGATEAHYRPLCPVNIKPQHYVEEEATYSHEQSNRRRAKARRRLGEVAHRVHAGTRTMLGGILTGLLGSLATFPLVLRVLFPRATSLARRLVGTIMVPPTTRLRLERQEQGPCQRGAGQQDSGPRMGYDVGEMTAIVEGLLRSMGLSSGLAELVMIVGHGSSSLNNPHEAAHDCGACGGGRGGPNARAFAEMANDARVRAALAERGTSIPDSVWFQGAYHNTCDDSMTYYDLDRLPVARRELFERARQALDEARARNAHERCRRFESASLAITPAEALQHVEGRSEDLSQTRPEYGHATNALCFVGRRAWSRGLFLDRRAFLTSYDPARDDEQCSVLNGLLQAVIPVCAGINLEYYFSFVDPIGYGCGTKLPHNITSMLGVMNGAASDLRPGLPWQMVEIHEPVRILFLIETTPAALQGIFDQNPGMARLVDNEWVQIATLDPQGAGIHVLRKGEFEPYVPEQTSLPLVSSSMAWYRGQRDHLGFATVTGAASAEGSAR